MNAVKAIIYESELNFIARCVLDYPNLETGGDYFGFWNKNNMPVILFVTGPGINTTRTSTSFYQDIQYLHSCGNYLNSKHALEHIGSWHSHHKLGLENPSYGDVNTVRNSLTMQFFDRFFITIGNITRHEDVKINGFLFSNSYEEVYKKVKWAVLPEASPIRLTEHRNRIFTQPKTRRAKCFIEREDIDIARVLVQEKVQLAENSYFETNEGKSFLKNEFQKISRHVDCKNVEIIQHENKMIGITFSYLGKEIEVRYPNNFSKINPNPLIVEKEHERDRNVFTIDPTKDYFLNHYDIIIECHNKVFGFYMNQSQR